MMSSAASMIASYHEWTEKTERNLLSFADNLNYTDVSPTKDWPLASFDSALTVMIAYLGMVIVGSMIMKVLPIRPLNLKALQFIYNPLQIMLSSYMCLEAGILAYRNQYSLTPCNNFNPSNPAIANVLWIFYMSKILDFMDTLFIIAGQRWKQLSLLHVYHHMSIFIVYWLNLRAGYDGDIYFTIFLNGFIHAIMYTYYFISMHTKDIWWKKYLTVMQMIQFLLFNIQGVYMLTTGCKKYPRNVVVIYLIYVQSIFWLFMNFFIQSYLRKPKGSSNNTTAHRMKKLA